MAKRVINLYGTSLLGNKHIFKCFIVCKNERLFRNKVMSTYYSKYCQSLGINFQSLGKSSIPHLKNDSFIEIIHESSHFWIYIEKYWSAGQEGGSKHCKSEGEYSGCSRTSHPIKTRYSTTLGNFSNLLAHSGLLPSINYSTALVVVVDVLQ